jgi:phosphohistidine phosphatase
MGGQLPVDAYRSLYEADTDLVLQYLREVDEGVSSVLLVGHNPAMYRLAWELTGDDPGGDGEDGEDGDVTADHAALDAHGFPTCALAAVALQVAAWEDVAHGCGRLAGVFKPPY